MIGKEDISVGIFTYILNFRTFVLKSNIILPFAHIHPSRKIPRKNKYLTILSWELSVRK